MQAVEHYCHTPKWLTSYLWRILKAPIQLNDVELRESEKGVPQGGVISPLLADLLNEKVRGWIAYFGKFAHSSMLEIYAHINFRLVKWCKKKYKKFAGDAITWLRLKWQQKPNLFAHWQQTTWFCYPFTRKLYS